MIVYNDRRNMNDHRGYKIKNIYKYLEYKINSSLDTRTGLEELNIKLQVYLRRNNWINKHNHTQRSLVTLAAYYQHSRIVYCISCFLDKRDKVDSVEMGSRIITKSIFDFIKLYSSEYLEDTFSKTSISLFRFSIRVFVTFKLEFKSKISFCNAEACDLLILTF